MQCKLFFKNKNKSRRMASFYKFANIFHISLEVNSIHLSSFKSSLLQYDILIEVSGGNPASDRYVV